MATSPPLPPSPSLDDLLVPPIPSAPTLSMRDCGDMDGDSVDIFPPFVPTVYVPPPIPTLLQETDKCYSRGRSRSRSRSPPLSERSASSCHLSPSPYRGPIYVNVPPIPPIDSLYDTASSPSLTYCPDYLRSPSPPRHKRSIYRSRTPSPIRRSCMYTPPQMFYPPAPPPILPSLTPPPPVPPAMWPPAPAPVFLEPVDILTFHYNKNMAYAPAAKTYEEAIDNVLELWPDLREFDRDRVHLFVGGVDQLVRVPKMAWQLVLCDLPRYEVVHIQVDQLPPPPQYQSDGKVNLASGDEKKAKQAKSGGLFSSIKRIFWR